MEKKHPYLSLRYQDSMESAFSGARDEDHMAPDTVNFCIGDPDIRTHDLIIQGAMEDSFAGMTNYTDARGMLEVRREVCKFYKEEYDIDVDPQEVIMSTSACEAFVLAMEAVLDDGDEVLIPSPFFGVYEDQVRLTRGTPVYIETTFEENFELTPEKLEAHITDKSRILVINTPNNPSGACLTIERLEEIYKIAEKHDLLILADDIYTNYSYAEEFRPIQLLEPKERKRIITVNSFSKDYVMTGWRIGNIIADKEICRVMNAINEAVVFSAPTVSQRAALHALRHRHEIQPELKREFKKRMDYAYERIKNLKGVRIHEPRGTFYLFANVENTGLTSAEVVKKMEEEAHVLVLDGKNFGPGGDGNIRFALTLSIEKMAQAFDRLEKMEIFRK